jgi:hypothetical protein
MMAQQLVLEMEAQHNLETGKSRTMKVYVGVPETGCNPDTGMVVLAGEYGSKTTSNIYVKLRNILSDTFNMIVIQCDFLATST